jgi:hypothetical protein
MRAAALAGSYFSISAFDPTDLFIGDVGDSFDFSFLPQFYHEGYTREAG